MSTSRALQLLEKCKNMKQLKQAHAQIFTVGLGDDRFALSRIMAFCSHPENGSLVHARILFEWIETPTLCICNTMIKALLLKGEYVGPIQIYCRMLYDDLRPDNYTLPYVLKACANLADSRTGAGIHNHVLRLGFQSDTFIGNTLILMYMGFGDAKAAREVFGGIHDRTTATWTVMISGYTKMGEVEAARAIFDEAPIKDRGVWGSMISGYVQNNCFKEGLSMFRLMQTAGLEPDEGVFVSALCACAQLGAMDLGTWIYHYLNHISLPISVKLGTALIDMYVKCGSLSLGRKVFDDMPQRDTICWNAMMLGSAMHGDGKGAFELFSSMRKEGCRPDDITFIAVLTACCHSGMVEEGLRIFNSMWTEYCIEPKGEHYGCVVNFLGRAGYFEAAKEIVDRLPPSSSASEKAIAWRALMSACWEYGNTPLAEVVAGYLSLLEFHSGVYVLLSNIYENSGKHDEAGRTRRCMKERGVPKAPGCSSIELGGRVHEFIAGEQIHPQIWEIYKVVKKLNEQLPPSG